MTRRGFVLAFTAPALMLHAETTQEKGKRAITKTLAALGGDAFLHMRNRTEIGRAYSFYREELSGLSIARIYTKYLEPQEHPGPEALRAVQRQVFGKKQEDAIIFTASEAYEVTFRGAKPLQEDRVTRFHETMLHDIFYVLRERMNEPGMAFESRGQDVIENQPVEMIDVFDAENRNITVWVNVDTYLPVKQRFYRRDPITRDRLEEVTRYTKYRDVGNGVMWPFNTQRERDTEKTFELYSERVTINDDLSDSLFELPGGIKILKK